MTKKSIMIQNFLKIICEKYKNATRNHVSPILSPSGSITPVKFVNMVANNPTKFQQNPSMGFRGVAPTRNVTDGGTHAQTQPMTMSLRHIVSGDNK